MAALALALADLAAVSLVVPPKVITLSIRIALFVHSGQEHEVAGICLGMIGLLAALTAAAACLLGQWARQNAFYNR